jgi:hypothetical protein
MATKRLLLIPMLALAALGICVSGVYAASAGDTDGACAAKALGRFPEGTQCSTSWSWQDIGLKVTFTEPNGHVTHEISRL